MGDDSILDELNALDSTPEASSIQTGNVFDFDQDIAAYFIMNVKKMHITKDHLEVMLGVLMTHVHQFHFMAQHVKPELVWRMYDEIIRGSGIQTVQQTTPAGWDVEFD
ncbi:hypothetical protein SAMN02799624_05298 [Paenibacillus sp. UNC496MF]|uniref:hypothetical protein n=1 Tax=Paenibacillus sp. UNC496MF TaxID=1502753 RepID=UPI0008DF7F80|nr:hypothetical protein [Paenibacillus sp. UNC496MF]SFJ63733.1 hypothetical protein SAMN02799624_05298 [Paenibacillus sp. UNC496MF]